MKTKQLRKQVNEQVKEPGMNQESSIFVNLVRAAEQAAAQANSLSKPELVSTLQSMYAQLLQLALLLGNGDVNKAGLANDSAIIATIRSIMAKREVAELLLAGWYLECVRRPLSKKNGPGRVGNYWRLRRWVSDGLGGRRRETKYIGVSYDPE